MLHPPLQIRAARQAELVPHSMAMDWSGGHGGGAANPIRRLLTLLSWIKLSKPLASAPPPPSLFQVTFCHKLASSQLPAPPVAMGRVSKPRRRKSVPACGNCRKSWWQSCQVYGPITKTDSTDRSHGEQFEWFMANVNEKLWFIWQRPLIVGMSRFRRAGEKHWMWVLRVFAYSNYSYTCKHSECI